jgi:hypothetical protein
MTFDPSPHAQRVLVIGIDPHAVAHLGIDADLVASALARGQERFAAAGVTADLCLVGLEQEDATRQIVAALTTQSYDCVVIGGGIRKPPPMLEFFEQVINMVRRHAPAAAIAFNTNGENSLDAAQRWLHASGAP